MADESVYVVKGDPAAILSESTASLEIAKLMQGLNTLGTLHRALFHALEDDYDRDFGRLTTQGDQVVILAIIVGLLKEAADAFRQASKTLKDVARNTDPLLFGRLQQLNSKLERDNGDSFYAVVLKPIRNDIAFHWNRTHIQAALSSRQGSTDLILSRTRTRTGGDEARFTLLDAITAETVVGVRDANKARERIAIVRDFSAEFLSVGFESITLWLAANGFSYEEGP